MPTPRAGASGSSDDPYQLRGNAPVSVVRAAKASLKEPTRPVTPADYGRQLFSSGDPSNRPSTSYSVSGSKAFYQDGGPKLALPKLETGRSDTSAGGGTLRKAPSGAEREPSRLGANPLPGLEATLAPGGIRAGRQTAAETVASLKANMGIGGGVDGDFSFPRPSVGPASHPHAPPDPTASAGGRAASLTLPAAAAGGFASPSGHGHHTTSTPAASGLAPEYSYGGYGGFGGLDTPGGGGEGPLLDPRRNDDLPPRPGTSRGRPGSAALSDMDPITERYAGPPPGVQDLGNGAQVLDMAAFAQYSDDDENDYAGHHQHHHPKQHSHSHHQHPHGAAPPAQHGAHHRSAAAAAAASDAAGAVASPRRGGSVSGSVASASTAPAAPSAASTSASAAAAALELDGEYTAWRASVEATLADLSASISGKAGTAALCGHAGRLVGLVEEVRRREHSSRWLNSACSAGSGFRDGGGGGGGGQALLSLREAISEHVFRLMDSGSAELLMKACAVVLRVVKSRQPLLQTAKLLYRLSKDGGNDALFRREGLLEPLVHTVHIMVASARGSSNPANMHEPLVYMNGCLKNISNEPSNQKSLVKLGSLHVLAALLQQLAEQAKSGDEALTESCGQVAVQASGVLRNLAVPAQNAPAFLAAGVLPALRAAVSALSGHTEVVLNAGRILSKLTLHDGCQDAISTDPEYAPLLIQLLGQYADNRAILLRVAFVLGNLTTNSNEYREQVCNVPFALVTVVGILQRYAFGGGPQPEGAATGGSAAADRLAKAASHEDCLVKVLRLAANLAIWQEAGRTLAEEEHVANALLALLERYSFEAAEELVLNTVCALTNLSFYQSEQQPGGFTNRVLLLPPSRLLPRITPLLLCDNEEAVVEAARVYGNFSRSADVRDYMQATRVVEALVLLLDHSNAEVLYSVCGTLINFTMDSSRKDVLGCLGGVSRLVEVLGRTMAQGELSERDEAIVEVVCKALFNVASADEGAQPAGAAGAGGRGAGAAASAGAGAGVGPGCSFSHEEVAEVLGLLEVLEASSLAEAPEVAAVLGRLGGQMRRLQARLSSEELEALPE
ncbi:hypothetical protein HYH02_013436 [Chlamydomonas schloesseri]|uniref:Uncharacterized protein n=1 Tax=Chlamydomonas schloesseri TaxID=2026947 RepID=A0A835VX98_9CHLO|nr:hypothetical protein HYH02_013436 [Chlamydomonas schloesseri]|eukprot:KAG2431305.1 hypothetical protein HYH02_013436 [Chlamydomonas schloesseri]